MPKTIAFISKKGGCAKTSSAIPLVDHLSRSSPGTVFVDADCEPETDDLPSSLSAFFPEAHKLAIGASVKALLQQPTLALSHWDRLYELACATDMLVDFGANVAGSLLTWFETSGIPKSLVADGVGMDIVVVTTADPISVSNARFVLEKFQSLRSDAMRLFLALSYADGPFDAYVDSPEYAAFARLVDADALTMLQIPYCASEIWSDCRRHFITPYAAMMMDEKELSYRRA